MRAIVQRVSFAEVEVDAQSVAKIARGQLVLAGFEDQDTEEDLLWMAGKLARLRIFPDEKGAMNLSLTDIQGELLLVSQFTLYASTKKGNRPSFARAGEPQFSKALFERFAKLLEKEIGKTVPTGIFGAEMKISLLNEGPVTLFLDSKDRQ